MNTGDNMNKRYNKPIPLGWYAIEYTDNLKPGDVKPIHYFGRELVLFRTEAGEASITDAYCPHLGAHLGHGGVVKGESISCPFHAWEFDNTGTCTNIPYAKKIPAKVQGKPCIRSYPIVERNQMIWAWYHPKDEAPSFEINLIEELHSDSWGELEVFDWTINSIIQETGENAADIAHFVTVHDIPDMPEGIVTMDGAIRRTELVSQAQALDMEGNIDESGENLETNNLESYSIGPGFTYQKFSRLFDIVMMGTLTPIDDQTIQMRFNFTLPKQQTGDNKLYADAFRDEIVRQVNQDIPIWENKMYRESPILCDGDGPIAKYRKWFQQFYVE